MALSRFFVLLSLVLLLILGCKNKPGEMDVSTYHLPHTGADAPGPLVGKWTYSSNFWYTAELELQDNGSFTYHDQGCYGQQYSKGRWKQINGTVFLNSDDSFNEIKPAAKAAHTGKASAKTHRKKGETEIIFTGLEDIQPVVMPGPGDRVRIFFDNTRFDLKGNTLCCTGAEKLAAGTRFCRVIN